LSTMIAASLSERHRNGAAEDVGIGVRRSGGRCGRCGLPPARAVAAVANRPRTGRRVFRNRSGGGDYEVDTLFIL
jgi:hypothetical protein